MQWDNGLNAGFTEGIPWLRVDKRFQRMNVASETNDYYSMLTFYRQMIELRQKEICLMIGDYQPLFSDNQMIAYFRKMENEPCFLIVLNLSHRPCYFISDKMKINGKIVHATSPELIGIEVTDELNLSGDEGVIIRLNQR
jgi:alpha-glucosidase